MNIVLIRHGQKVPSPPEEDNVTPLAPEGLAQVDHLKNQLAHLKLRPTLYLTSKFKRAEQTVERLLDVYPIDALTPENNTLISENILETIINQAEREGIELDQETVVAIVGHEPQLGQLLASLTSTPAQPIDTGKGVWVRAASLSDFLQGKGEIQQKIDSSQLYGNEQDLVD